MAHATDVIDRVDSDASRQWIARLRRLPEDCREFSFSPRRAKLEFGIDEAELLELLAAGLPHARVAGEPRLAAGDLHYAALRLDCAGPYRQAMGWWAASLIQGARGALEATVRCVGYVPVDTEVVFDHPAHARHVKVGPDRVLGTLELTTESRWPEPDAALAGLLGEIAALDFCWIPDAVPDAVALARSTGLADCASAARLLVEECSARGIEARSAHGLLLATPYSTLHNWAEIKLGERWTPFDPLLLALLTRHCGLDAAAWPPARSPGCVLARLAEQPRPLASVGGEPIDLTFLTALRSASE